MDELTLIKAAAVVVLFTSVVRVIWLVMEVIQRTGWETVRKAGLLFVAVVALTVWPLWRRRSGDVEGGDEF